MSKYLVTERYVVEDWLVVDAKRSDLAADAVAGQFDSGDVNIHVVRHYSRKVYRLSNKKPIDDQLNKLIGA